MHSVYRPGEWLTGDYWDEMLVLPFADRAGAAALGRDPRQRRRHDGARLRPLLPGARASTAVEIDRRADRRRAGALRPARARTCTLHTADARPFLRAHDAALRRDRRRRLPPALHPVLPGDARVLRARCATTSRPGGVVLVNVGHPERSDRLEKVLTATMGRRLPDASCATRSSTPTRCSSGTDAPALGAARCDAATRALPADAAAGRAAAAARLAPGAARRRASTPTTARRSSG